MESKRVFFVAQMMRSGVSFITETKRIGHLGSMKPLSKGEPGSLGNMLFFSEKVNALYLAVDDSTLIWMCITELFLLWKFQLVVSRWSMQKNSCQSAKFGRLGLPGYIYIYTILEKHVAWPLKPFVSNVDFILIFLRLTLRIFPKSTDSRLHI